MRQLGGFGGSGVGGRGSRAKMENFNQPTN